MAPLLDALALRARGGHCALVVRAGVCALRLAPAVAFQSTVSETCARLLGGGLVRAGCELLSARFHARNASYAGVVGAMRAQGAVVARVSISR